MESFTIITNTIRRPLSLVEKSVRSSISQSPEIEVVLVDQNERKLIFPKDVEQNPRLKHLHHPVPAVSGARNSAIYPTTTEWLIFCDDDGYLEEGYLGRLKELVKKFPETDIFAGGIKRIDTSEYYSKRHAVGGDMSHFWNTKLLMGSNFVIRKEVFEELGKFDERFGAGAIYGSSEETDLAWNAYFHHKKMRYSPELIVFHVPPFAGETGPEIRKAFRYGLGKGALIRKWFFKGYFAVIYEVLEMILVPLLKAPLALVRFRMKEAGVQCAALFGRVIGLFYVKGNQS